MNVKHYVTTVNNNEIADPKLFNRLVCFLNFDGDEVRFEFSVANHRWEKTSVKKCTVTYEKVDSATYEKNIKALPSESGDPKEESDFTKCSIIADFKNTLLNLFSPHKKEFRLTIDYNVDSVKHQTIFFVVIPDIDQK